MSIIRGLGSVLVWRETKVKNHCIGKHSFMIDMQHIRPLQFILMLLIEFCTTIWVLSLCEPLTLYELLGSPGHPFQPPVLRTGRLILSFYVSLKQLHCPGNGSRKKKKQSSVTIKTVCQNMWTTVGMLNTEYPFPCSLNSYGTASWQY